MRRVAFALLALLAGCSTASPPSSASLAASLEQVVGALNATRSYTQATQNGNSFGLYVCEAKVTLGLAGTQGTSGGLTAYSMTMGASSSSTSSNTLEVTLQSPACSGHAVPAGAVPLMLKAPH
jgi:hypothetical protein